MSFRMGTLHVTFKSPHTQVHKVLLEPQNGGGQGTLVGEEDIPQ